MHACSAGIARMGVPALERSLHARRGRARARGCARRLRRCSRCARGVRACAARAPSRRPPRLRTPDGGGENTYVKGVWEALQKSADAVRNMAGKFMAAMEAASAYAAPRQGFEVSWNHTGAVRPAAAVGQDRAEPAQSWVERGIISKRVHVGSIAGFVYNAQVLSGKACCAACRGRPDR